MINSVNVLDHISVTVSDLERSLAFYRDLLGLREVERHRLDGDTISKMAGHARVEEVTNGEVGDARKAVARGTCRVSIVKENRGLEKAGDNTDGPFVFIDIT